MSAAAKLDPENESRCRERLREYLTSLGWSNADQEVESLLSLSTGFEDRFSWLDQFVPPDARARVLVSGCAVGSELVVARLHGYGEIHGTEVDPQFFSISQMRFAGDTSYQTALCQGVHLQHGDEYFDVVISGHVIEHSKAPFRYLAEHLRVLRSGGWLFLEFPHRYHPVELHTKTRSFEWLPWPLRDAALRARAFKWRGRDPQRVRISDGIRTDLRPVSLWQVRMYLRMLPGISARVVSATSPGAGIIRVAIQRFS